MNTLTLPQARGITESIVGPVQWFNATEGHCTCPGIHLHTTRNAPTDCKAVCATTGTLPPGVYCFHDSCCDEVDAASFALQSALGKRTPAGNRLRHAPLPPRPKPKFDPVKLARIAAKCPGVDAAWLAARSAIAPGTCTPASFLNALYRPGESVIIFDIFRSQGQAVWRHVGAPFDSGALDKFRRGRKFGVWYLCNPVSGKWAKNDTGKRSRRSWQCVTRWPYMVFESDTANPAHWLSMLAQMPVRIAAIYSSGGRSIHALVRIDAPSKAAWDAERNAIRDRLIILGADRKCLSAVRLTRLPLCERLGTEDAEGNYVPFDKPHMQELLYLNPEPLPIPLCRLEVRR